MKLGYCTITWGGVVGHAQGVTSVKDLFYLTHGPMDRAVADIAAAGYQGVEMFDGNLADYSGESFDLTGVKGTLPVAGDPDPAFNDRLLSIDPKLKDFSYGPQSYDATMIIALAAIAAGDDSGEAIGANIIDVTREGTQCSTFEECAALLEDGEDIDYEGASGPTDMNDTGSPASGTIGINEYTGNKYKQVDTVSGVVN